MKNFKILILSFLAFSTILTSCSKDDETGPGRTSHKIRFVAETSADAKISSVTYTGPSGDPTSNSSVNATTFSSGEITVSADVPAVSFIATGLGVNSSTIKAQIYVDGTLVKENSSTGSALVVNTSYMFQ